MTESVTRLRAPTTEDANGDDQPDWDSAAELEITGCAVAGNEEPEERGNGRQGVIIRHTIYAPAGTEVAPTDRLRFRGGDHEVDGAPQIWTSPFTDVTEGVEIQTRRVIG